jgi:hypothetical protein
MNQYPFDWIRETNIDVSAFSGERKKIPMVIWTCFPIIIFSPKVGMFFQVFLSFSFLTGQCATFVLQIQWQGATVLYQGEREWVQDIPKDQKEDVQTKFSFIKILTHS